MTCLRSATLGRWGAHREPSRNLDLAACRRLAVGPQICVVWIDEAWSLAEASRDPAENAGSFFHRPSVLGRTLATRAASATVGCVMRAMIAACESFDDGAAQRNGDG